MSKLKVLLLEDDQAQAQTVQEALAEALSDVLEVTARTELDPALLEPIAWDLLITDLKGGKGGQERLGDKVVEQVFEKRFIPMIVYSGVVNLEDIFSRYSSHPFLKLQSKNASDSTDAVVDHLRNFIPIARQLKAVREQIAKISHQTLTTTVDNLRGFDINWDEQLGYLVRRRIAASFDLPQEEGKKLAPIERYLLPSVYHFLLTGDILQSTENVNDLRIVLTQTCDLVWEGSRKPKVDALLVARNIDSGTLRKRLPDLSRGRDDKEQDALIEWLCRGDNPSVGLLPLPPIPGITTLPLVFDLKKIDSLPLVDIKDGCADPKAIKWKRIASQDSPFREQITSAVLAVLGRPALPDLDYSSVIQGLKDFLKPPEISKATEGKAPSSPPERTPKNSPTKGSEPKSRETKAAAPAAATAAPEAKAAPPAAAAAVSTPEPQARASATEEVSGTGETPSAAEPDSSSSST